MPLPCKITTRDLSLKNIDKQKTQSLEWVRAWLLQFYIFDEVHQVIQNRELLREKVRYLVFGFVLQVQLLRIAVNRMDFQEIFPGEVRR